MDTLQSLGASRSGKLTAATFAVGLFLLTVSSTTHAQVAGSSWSKPELLFSTGAASYTNELWLLRGRDDSLYLWWPVFPAGGGAGADEQARVFFTQRTGARWIVPVDVLTWPAAARLTSVVMDRTGRMHAFSGTTCLSYVYADHQNAAKASGWSKQRCLDDVGNSNVAAAIGTDDTIYVVYAARGTQALRLARSRDLGLTWSLTDIASVLDADEGFYGDPALAVDQQSRLQLVWTVYSPPEGYPPLGVLYARSDDGGDSWTPPRELGRVDEGQPAVAVYGDEVHVLWDGDARKRGRYYRNSRDGGKTWGPIQALSEEGAPGGLQRAPALVVDGVGHVHALLHEQESLYYTMKGEGGWTAKEPLYDAQRLGASEVYTIRLAITGGNRLNAFYTVYVDGGRSKRIYYQYRDIDAPAATPAALSAVVPTPRPTATGSSSLPSVSPTPVAVTGSGGMRPVGIPPKQDEGSALLISVVPACLIIITVVAARTLGRG